MSSWIAPVLLGLAAWTALSFLFVTIYATARALQRHRNGGPGR